MKIPNVAVVALIASYAVLGLIALPFEQYLWHWTHFVVILILGFIGNAFGLFGAGDAKFAAAAAPWTSGNRFPMGFPLAMTLVFYLILVLRPL